MLEYNIRTDDERLEELQNGIKSLAKQQIFFKVECKR